MDRYMSAKTVKEQFDITRQTLFNWEKQGLINPGKTPGGQRRYSEKEIREVLGLEPTRTKESVRLRSVAEESAEMLYREYGEIINGIILYGSVTRGEAHEESDIDMVVVIASGENSRNWRERLHRFLADLKVKHGVSMSLQTFTEEEWQNMKETNFRPEVSGKDGIRLSRNPV